MKKKRTIIFLCSFLYCCTFLPGCKPEEQKPDYVLSKDQMVQMLADIYVAEEKVRRLNLKSDSNQVVFEKIKDKIFTSHQLQDSIFRKSFDYYLDRPKEMELIYTALVDSLNLREQRESLKVE